MTAKKSRTKTTKVAEQAADADAPPARAAKTARKAATKTAQSPTPAPAPSDAEREVGAQIAEVIAAPARTPEEAQEQAHAVDAARAAGAVAAAQRLAASPPAAPRGVSSVTREPTGPADTEGAEDHPVNHIHDDATRNTTELAAAALRAKGARGEGR